MFSLMLAAAVLSGPATWQPSIDDPAVRACDVAVYVVNTYRRFGREFVTINPGNVFMRIVTEDNIEMDVTCAFMLTDSMYQMTGLSVKVGTSPKAVEPDFHASRRERARAGVEFIKPEDTRLSDPLP